MFKLPKWKIILFYICCCYFFIFFVLLFFEELKSFLEVSDEILTTSKFKNTKISMFLFLISLFCSNFTKNIIITNNSD